MLSFIHTSTTFEKKLRLRELISIRAAHFVIIWDFRRWEYEKVYPLSM